MESYEEDDDTHFCIKCHLTIHGLENYVRHRQSGCRPPDDKNVWVSPTTPASPTTVSYPEILNADAFFSSLELQSSSKTNPRKAPPSLLDEGKKSLKKEERRKKGGQRGGQVDAEEAKEKQHIHNMLPQVPVLVDDPTDYLCIPSLVGFPDIVSSKPAAAAHNGRNKLAQSMGHATGAAPSKTQHEAENPLVEGLMPHVEGAKGQGGDRKRQEEQVHQTWLEDTILAELVANNEAPSKDLARYGFEYQQEDEEEEEDEDEGEDEGEDESEEEEEEDEEEEEEDILEEDLGEEEEDGSYAESEEDRERSLRGHTGGKWKPELDDLPQNMSQLQDEDEDEQHQEHPPPSHTGGKWRPSDASHKEEYGAKGGNVGQQPPPGHTRGKWIPGARADVESAGYWCNPCGRKLASRPVYDRHLRSDLHARRSVREMDGALCLPRAASAAKKPRHQLDRQRGQGRGQAGEAKGVKKSVRRREKEVLCCEMCNARVRRAQMGKHLLSHYHCRVAGANPRGPRARRFLLENMANVVRQCPFQCFSCRFYCNTEDTFLRHWRSELHAKTLERISGSYRCTPCDFWCEENGAMESHLLDPGHRDVVSMMNGSVPIMIGRQRGLPCAGCDRRFRYNLQLRIHAKETGHEESLTASDEYQQRIRCKSCPRVVRSLVALQRHQLSCHAAKTAREGDAAPYFCSFCSMNFATAREAVLHRRTSSHKEVVKARKCSEAVVGRQCPHCEEKQANLSAHKSHLLDRHPELCYRRVAAPLRVARLPSVSRTCVGFQVPEVRHALRPVPRRDQAHEGEQVPRGGGVEDQGGRVEVRRVQLLDRLPLGVHLPRGASRGPRERRESGPRGQVLVPRLRQGVRQGVAEESHQEPHGGEAVPVRQVPGPLLEEVRPERPSEGVRGAVVGRLAGCRAARPEARLRLLRVQQRFLHQTLAEAAHATTRWEEVQVRASGMPDRASHSVRAEIARELGSRRYAVHQALQMLGLQLRGQNEDPASTRHVRLHTGTKPYKCRHCPYASNNLENLRKHVLSTNLHPGKTIYECDVCQGDDPEPFRTNFAKELRAHLLEAHSDAFSTPGHANDYVIGIFKVHRSTDFVDEPN